MRVFLTGGTGFIGQPLTRALLSRGWAVTALVRNRSAAQARALERLGASLTIGDVTDRESLRAPMTGADLVIHNAAVYEIGVNAAGRRRMRRVNVDGTGHVLGLCEELGVPRTVYVSSIVAFGDTGASVFDETTGRQRPAVSHYERSKADAHALALRHIARGLPVVIACPSAVLGPNDHSPWGYFLRLYLNGIMPPIAFAGDTILTPAYVDDLAEGIARCAERGRVGEAYILGGEPTTIRAAMDTWRRHAGGFAVRWYLPTWLAQWVFAPLAPLLRAGGLPAFISRETVRAAAAAANFSSARAWRELGWKARPTDELWAATIDKERALQARRKGQGLLGRLRTLAVVDDGDP